MRSAERQVASALAERSSRGGKAGGGMGGAAGAPAAAAQAAATAASAALPPWLVHWRLLAALSSQQLFTELFCELSEAAARCYAQCGWQRHAALLRADVADALAKAGALPRAAALYERQCRTFLRLDRLGGLEFGGGCADGRSTMPAHARPTVLACPMSPNRVFAPAPPPAASAGRGGTRWRR